MLRIRGKTTDRACWNSGDCGAVTLANCQFPALGKTRKREMNSFSLVPVGVLCYLQPSQILTDTYRHTSAFPIHRPHVHNLSHILAVSQYFFCTQLLPISHQWHPGSLKAFSCPRLTLAQLHILILLHTHLLI